MKLFNKLFNKKVYTNMDCECSHCHCNGEKLNKCQSCGEKSICMTCKYQNEETLCKSCDIEYSRWFNKMEKKHEEDINRNKKNKKKLQYDHQFVAGGDCYVESLL